MKTRFAAEAGEAQTPPTRGRAVKPVVAAAQSRPTSRQPSSPTAARSPASRKGRGHGARSTMNEIARDPHIGGYVPLGGRAGEGVGARQVHGRSHPAGDAGRAHLSQPLCARRDPRRRRREAPKLPGVMAIVTGADCAKTFGVLPIARSEHPLARDKVRYKGEPVAAVAAIDEATAEKARPPHQDEGARAAGLFHRRRRRSRLTPCRSTTRSPATSSAMCCSSWATSPTASPRPIWCARPPTIAPRCARTRWRCTPRSPTTTPLRDRLTVHASTQVPYYVHLMLAQILDMDMSKIRVVKPFVGGGFGCRTEMPQRRADRRAAGAQGRRRRAHHAQPRRHLHHPPRPARDRHPHEDRPAQGRQDHRGRVRVHPARRRALGLRRGDDPLFRLDALRHLRPAQRQVHRQARADQHAAVRGLPRPRHRRRALRLREPARPDGGRDGPRSARRAARQLAAGADLHRQRPDGEQLRPARVHRLGRERERLGGAQGQARPNGSARAWALPARTTSPAPPSP